MTTQDEVQLQPDVPRPVKLLAGFVDPKTGVWYDRAVVQEIDGALEDLLAKDDIPWKARIEGILIGATSKFLPAPGQMIDGEPPPPLEHERDIRRAIAGLCDDDGPYLLLQLRIIAPGPIFWYEADCPNEDCERDGPIKLYTDLRLLETHAPSNPKERVYEVDLGRAGVAKMKTLTVLDVEHRAELVKQTGDLFTSELFARMLLLNDKTPEYEQVKKLGTTARTKLRHAIARHEPSVQNKVRHRCPTCNANFQLTLGIGSVDFFFPAATSDPWSTSSDSGSTTSEEATSRSAGFPGRDE